MKTLILLFSLTFGSALFAQSYTSYNQLLNKYVAQDGDVDYSGLSKDKKRIEKAIAEIQRIKPNTASKNERLAYWMNAYNLFTLQLVAYNYPVKSIKDLSNGKPWDKRFITLHGKVYSLNDIEHKILRKMGDPRIHIGINCASVSCPALSNKAFTATNVQSQLDVLSRKFVNDRSKNQISNKSVKISKLFDWFSSDFKGANGALVFINRYANNPVNLNAKVRYMDYNWNLNKK